MHSYIFICIIFSLICEAFVSVGLDQAFVLVRLDQAPTRLCVPVGKITGTNEKSGMGYMCDSLVVILILPN
jgi:hypothetical protein